MVSPLNPVRFRHSFQPILFVLCFITFSTTFKAQERYSADSLIAVFVKNPLKAPKGVSITFTDVVVESQKTRVVFKSSANDRVICELAGLPANSSEPTVGSTLTVIGRVRGRGMLGNVTLDNCSLKPTEVVTEAAPAITPPVNNDPPPAPVEASVEPVTEPVDPPVEVKESEPVPVAVAAVAVASVAPNKPSSPVRPREVSRSPEPPAQTEAPAPKPPEPIAKMTAPSNRPTQPVSNSSRSQWINIAYAIGGFLVGVALLSFIRRAPSAPRSRRRSEAPSTAETRRMALEELLSRQKKLSKI